MVRHHLRNRSLVQMWDKPAMATPEELGIVHTSFLTDADWAEINKLNRAFKSGGEAALRKAYRELAEHPSRWVRVFGAFFPDKLREILKDKMAEVGLTDDDLIELDRKLQGPARIQ
jgi:hypothetical protein